MEHNLLERAALQLADRIAVIKGDNEKAVILSDPSLLCVGMPLDTVEADRLVQSLEDIAYDGIMIERVDVGLALRGVLYQAYVVGVLTERLSREDQ